PHRGRTDPCGRTLDRRPHRSRTCTQLSRPGSFAGDGSERLGSAVRPGEDAFPMPQHRLLVRLIERGLEEHVRHEILETEGYFTDKFGAEHRSVVEAFWMTAWKSHADGSWYLRYVMARPAYEATPRLPFLKPPVLVLVGSSDMAGGGAHFPASKMLADRIPKSELKIINGVSHGFFWEKPEVTAETLEAWFEKH